MFIDDLREAIRRNRPLPALLDGFISVPKKKDNPLIKLAFRVFGKEELEQYLTEAIRGYLPDAIKQKQEALCLLNTLEGREYLHKNLDALLDYLTTSEKYMVENEYRCPCCQKSFFGQHQKCPCCKKGLRWK